MGSNTKTYLLSLLLLFLLEHTSVAGLKLPKGVVSLFKPIKNDFSIDKANKMLEKRKEFLEKSKDRLEEMLKRFNHPTPPALSSQPRQIKDKGIKQVKEYLNSYGYLPDSDGFNDVLDAQFNLSVRDYQKFFHLNVTGNPQDRSTRMHMSLLRCGVPDKNLRYDFSTDDNMSLPVGTQWFFPEGRTNLTYGFAQADKLPEKLTKVFADSFKRWSEAIKVVNLTEAKYEDADIRIEFMPLEEINPDRTEVVGATYIGLLPSKGSLTNVTFGAMVLDDSKYMVLPSEDLPNPKVSFQYGVVDLESVVMHQIGHLLGLQHSSHEESVMYPSILPWSRKVNLSKDDKEMIKQAYSSSSSSSSSIGSERGNVTNLAAVSNLTGSVWGLVITTLSLGLACLVLFY